MSELTKAVKASAIQNSIPFANLMAVVEIESNGIIFAKVNGANEPLIRWEGHYFDKRLSGKSLTVARNLGLADPQAGGVANPSSQQRRWNELLLPAAKINSDAAYESCSWGIGQVMGSHWEALGYSSVKAMVKRARDGVEGQIELMLRYCKKFDLIDELQRGDFVAFARGYNGPANKGYGAKMKEAALRWGGATVDRGSEDMLSMGMNGRLVREVQTLLMRAGYAVKVDGDFGPATKTAVQEFQKANKLEVDGLVGPETWQALTVLKVSPDEEPGKERVRDVAEVQEGMFGTIFSGGTAGVTDQLKEIAGSITGEAPIIEYISAGLYTLAASIFVGSIVWGVYGYMKSRRTE